MPHLAEILVATQPGVPMRSVPEALAVAGKGLDGDRYHRGTGTFSPSPQRPDFEVTLVESEKLAAFAAASGFPFAPADARRNLVTVGVDLNALVGMEFSVGAVVLRGIRLCEPCTHLARVSRPEVLAGLVHRGGLRAAIVAGGPLRVGDPIAIRAKE